MLKPNRRPLLIALCVAGAGLFGAAVAHSASPAPMAFKLFEVVVR